MIREVYSDVSEGFLSDRSGYSQFGRDNYVVLGILSRSNGLEGAATNLRIAGLLLFATLVAQGHEV